jgi:hypothetical protein
MTANEYQKAESSYKDEAQVDLPTSHTPNYARRLTISSSTQTNRDPIGTNTKRFHMTYTFLRKFLGAGFAQNGVDVLPSFPAECLYWGAE